MLFERRSSALCPRPKTSRILEAGGERWGVRRLPIAHEPFLGRLSAQESLRLACDIQRGESSTRSRRPTPEFLQRHALGRLWSGLVLGCGLDGNKTAFTPCPEFLFGQSGVSFPMQVRLPQGEFFRPTYRLGSLPSSDGGQLSVGGLGARSRGHVVERTGS